MYTYPSFAERFEDRTLSPLDTNYKRTDVRLSSRRRWTAKAALPGAVTLTLLTIALYIYSSASVKSARTSSPPSTSTHAPDHDPTSETSELLSYVNRNYTQALVVASTTHDDTSWVARDLPHLDAYIYVADDPEAQYRPPKNKGHETMHYLTYIIDHYDSLPDISIFTHASNEAWHNNLIQRISISRMLQHLLPSHVARVGFFNLRCHGESGCGNHIDLSPAGTNTDADETGQSWVRKAWPEIHGPDVPIPPRLSAPCCSQFAVTRQTLQRIPLARWHHYRDWLLHTSLPDSISGRIWEFTWHFILTNRAELCPSMNACYCQGYGICFGSEAQVENYLGLIEVDWLARKWQKNMREEDGGHRVADEIDDHMVTGASRQLGHRWNVARLRGKDPAVRAKAEDE